MKQYRTNNNKLITDTYIKLDYIKSLDLLISIGSNRAIDTNIKEFSSFINDLEECESKSPKNKDTKTIYGSLLTFLLDQEVKTDPETLKLFTKEIANKYPGTSYYCYLETKGQGSYLKVYICDREYKPEGINTEVKAKADIYRNSETGRLCKKDDPKAVLINHKDEVIGVRSSKFTSKKRLFNYANKEQFNAWLLDLKKWFIDLTERLINIAIKIAPSFKKYVIKAYQDKQERSNAKRYNRVLRDLEGEFMKRYDYLEGISDELNGEINPGSKAKLDNIFNLINNKIINNENFNAYSKDPTFKDKEVTDKKTGKTKIVTVKQNRGHKFIFNLDLKASKETAEENIKQLTAYFKQQLERVN